MPNKIDRIQLVHGIPKELRPAAAAMYDEAFGAKFAVAVPARDSRIALLQDSLDLRFAIGAIVNDKLVGLAGYKTQAGSLTRGMNYRALIRRLGGLRGNWAACVFSLYERSLKPRELLMDGIAVDATMRGRGLGTKLLERLAEIAREGGYRTLRLDVIDTNPKARRLYERNGFVPTRTEHFGYLRWLLGFGASATLVRKLAARP